MTISIQTTAWKEFPDQGATPKHVFALTDLHGRLDLAKPMLDHLAGLPAQAETVLVNCGDALDRGAHGIQLAQLLMKQDDRFGEVVLLCGNHEIMVMDAFWQNGVDAGPRFSEGNLRRWLRCGGEAVYDELSPDGTLPYFLMDDHVQRELGAYIRRVGGRKDPHHIEGDLLFIHAGVTPGKGFYDCLAMSPQAEVSMGDHWAWMRNPFLLWRGGWERPARIVVHGHTVCVEDRVMTAEGIVPFMDHTGTHKRICLDSGGFDFGHIAALEAIGTQYRFHVAFDRGDEVDQWRFQKEMQDFFSARA